MSELPPDVYALANQLARATRKWAEAKRRVAELEAEMDEAEHAYKAAIIAMRGGDTSE